MVVTQRFVDVHGIRTHYLLAGETHGRDGAWPVLVLLHGGGVDCARLSWEPLMSELGQDFRVIAPDFPGFGESDKPLAPYGVAFYADFLCAFLDMLGIRHASMAGISMGGAVALSFALFHPSRVDKLVLVDSYGLQRKVPFHLLSSLFVKLPGINEATWLFMHSRAMVRYMLQSLLKNPQALTPELLDQAYHEATRHGAGRAWKAFQRDEITWQGVRTCYLDRLGEISTPTLVIHGSQDTLVPPECARAANTGISGSRLHWLEGCGHWSQRDAPQEFMQVMQQFLKKGSS